MLRLSVLIELVKKKKVRHLAERTIIAKFLNLKDKQKVLRE